MLIATLSALLLAGSPAATTDAGPATEKPVCKSTYEVGSRIPKRICRSRQEWAAEAEQQKRDLESGARNNRLLAPVPGG